MLTQWLLYYNNHSINVEFNLIEISATNLISIFWGPTLSGTIRDMECGKSKIHLRIKIFIRTTAGQTYKGNLVKSSLGYKHNKYLADQKIEDVFMQRIRPL